MLKVGLTGGMACGKSFVAAALGKLGCHIIDADDIARHEVLNPGGDAYDAVLDEFGDEILDERGMIDRARLGELVFGDPVKLEKLNAIAASRACVMCAGLATIPRNRRARSPWE